MIMILCRRKLFQFIVQSFLELCFLSFGYWMRQGRFFLRSFVLKTNTKNFRKKTVKSVDDTEFISSVVQSTKDTPSCCQFLKTTSDLVLECQVNTIYTILLLRLWRALKFLYRTWKPLRGHLTRLLCTFFHCSHLQLFLFGLCFPIWSSLVSEGF